jgi:uncharacterized protein (DUF1330 family)
MTAYFVVDVSEISDPQMYAEYRKDVDATLVRYGGTFLVRGGEYETIEGEWQSQRFVILAFDTVAQFKRWYNSSEYSAIRDLRLKASRARAVVMQGVQRAL